jgi:hypothetical protein
MNFQEWWQQMTPAEQRVLSENNAKFVWEECQKHTLMTIEDACKAQVAYDEGLKEGLRQGQEAFKVHIGGYRLTPGVQPGMIWISNAAGEGGDFRLEELSRAIDQFFKDQF